VSISRLDKNLHSAKEGVDRFLISCTCIGLEIDSGTLYAPYGLAALEQGALRMNPHFPQPELFVKKSPELSIAMGVVAHVATRVTNPPHLSAPPPPDCSAGARAGNHGPVRGRQ
jgi:hypothetical protein